MVKLLGSVALVLAIGCATGRFPGDMAEDAKLVAPDGLVEFAVDEHGGVLEVEFHVPLAALPAEVRAAAEREMPGGQVLDCEKEHDGGKVYWEVTKRIGGKEQEALFDDSGRVIAWELEVDAASVPAAVLQAADEAVGGRRTKVEEIRDGEKRLVEYHVKKTDRAVRYKLVVTPAGRVVRIWREMTAEIEVPAG